jgi:hypothetical protein
MSENNQSTLPKSNGRGGARAGAGRKKGAATQKTREIADREIDNGLTPLEYMLQVMRTEPSPELELRDMLNAVSLRFEAAKAAAPYMHPRLAAVEHTGRDGGAIEHSIEVVFHDAGED